MPRPGDVFGGRFPIGWDNVQIGTMAAVARRGANLLVRADLEAKYTLTQWVAAAGAAGLKTIRPPSTEIRDDSTLVAVNIPDEPNLLNHYYGPRPPQGWPAGVKIWNTVTVGGVLYDLVGGEQYPAGMGTVKTGATLDTTAVVVRAQIAAARALNPGVPVFCNFAGNAVTSAGPRDESGYVAMTADADWVGNDAYPVDNDLVPTPIPPGAARRYNLDWPARALDRLQAWSGFKPNFAYISCVSQRLDNNNNPAALRPGRWPWRWPTVDEIKCQVWAALIAGAEGIIYFGMQSIPWRSDAIISTLANDYGQASAADIAAARAVDEALPVLNAEIQGFAKYLNSGQPVPVAGLPTGVAGGRWTLPDGSTLTAVVNFTGAAAGEYGPAEVRISEVPAAAPQPGPLPPDSTATDALALANRALQLATKNAIRLTAIENALAGLATLTPGPE